jgi:hypothetical protein
MVTKKKKQKAVDDMECPYCADPKFFDRVLTPTPQDRILEHHPTMRRFGSHWVKGKKFKKHRPPKGVSNYIIGLAPDPRFVVTLNNPEIRRGEYRIKTVTDEYFITRYAGFKVEIIGLDSDKELPKPSGAFLSYQWTEGEGGKPEKFIYYFAARITHKDSALKIDLHSHLSHGRLITVHGFSSHQNRPEELAIIERAFEFYRLETRGGGTKIDEEALRRAIRKRGEGATQKEIAADLQIVPRSLRRWIEDSELKGWDAAKRYYLGLPLYPLTIEVTKTQSTKRNKS